MLLQKRLITTTHRLPFYASARTRQYSMTRRLRISANSLHSFVSLSPSRPLYEVSRSVWRPRQLESGFFVRFGSTMASNNRVEYNWIRDVETLEEYRPGGYHPVMIGDVLRDRYQIADKLGFGGYSTVWLARDTHLNRYVAIKINRAKSLPRESKVLKDLSAARSSSSVQHPGHGLVPVIQDEFSVKGPNGTHTCYAVTPAQCNLREISFSRLFPLDVARALSYGLTQAVAYTHLNGYVHGGSSNISLECILRS